MKRISNSTLAAAAALIGGFAGAVLAGDEAVVTPVAPTSDAELTASESPVVSPEALAPIRAKATPATGRGARPSIADTPVFFDDEEFPIWTNAAPGFDMSWNTLDGGGVTFASGGDFDLGGTIGQPDTDYLSGGGFTLAGGFWGRVASPPDCPGDANGDNAVDFADITAVLANWLDFGAAGDVNNDWEVNFLDITIILANWGATCP